MLSRFVTDTEVAKLRTLFTTPNSNETQIKAQELQNVFL